MSDEAPGNVLHGEAARRARDCAARALEVLVARGETLAAAESLTGGLVGVHVTAAPGASRAFQGAVTAYATELKRGLLGVDGALLDERGAVDAEVARQMATGVRRLLGADWGVSTTGVAGPEPQDGRPVGTVYVAVAGPDGAPARAVGLRLPGDRSDVREASARAVLELLCDQLNGNAAGENTEHDGGNGCLQP